MKKEVLTFYKLGQTVAVPDEIPNDETLEAFEELKNGGGHTFSGTTEQLFAELEKK